MQYLIAAFVALLASTAVAQQPDPIFLQRAIAAVQAQRNMAQDAAAVAAAQADALKEENAKLKAELDKAKCATPPG